MDGLIEKFNVFDFFNLIIGGFFFLVGLGGYFYFNTEKSFFSKLTYIFTEYTLLSAVVLFVLSFVLGIIMSELEYFFFYEKLKWEQKLISECLRDFRIVENKKKYEIYKKRH